MVSIRFFLPLTNSFKGPQLRHGLVLLFTIAFYVSPATANESTDKLSKAYWAVKSQKYGSLNSLSAMRRVQKIVTGPTPLIDILNSPETVFRTKVSEVYPAMPLASGVVDNRPGFLDKVAKGADATLRVRILPLIDSGSHDRGLSLLEKKELQTTLQVLTTASEDGSLSSDRQKLVQLALRGYFSIGSNPEDRMSDPDLAELNTFAEILDISTRDIKNGQSDILGAIANSRDQVADQVWKAGSKIVAATSDRLDIKFKKFKESLDEDLKNQQTLFSGALRETMSATDRIEGRLIFLAHREESTALREEVLGARDTAQLDRIIKEAETCQSVSIRCAVLTNKNTMESLQEAKVDLEFNIKINSAKNAASSLGQIAALTGNQDLVSVSATLTKVTMTIETVSKMSDLLTKALVSGALSSMGDITSMVSLGTTLMTALAGPSGPTPEQMMLEALQKIQEQIAEFREEVEERFNTLDQSILELGITVNNGFENVNANQVQLAKGQEVIQSMMENTSLQISKTTNLVQSEAVKIRIESLRALSNSVASTHNIDNLEDFFFELGSTFNAFLGLKDGFQVLWADPKTDTTDDLTRLISDSLTGDGVNELRWLDMLAQLAAFSSRNFDNEECRGIDSSTLTLFSLLSEPVADAMSETFDNASKEGITSPNKFQHFLRTAPIEKEYFQNFRESYQSYTTSVENLKRCMAAFAPHESAEFSSFGRYLLQTYREKVSSYLKVLSELFTNGTLLKGYQNAVTNPNSGLFEGLGTQFINMDIEKRGGIDFSVVEEFSSYEVMTTEMTSKAIVKRLFPKISDCRDPKDTMDVPVSLVLKSLPKHETWLSLLLGLNTIDICFETVGKGLFATSHLQIFELQYHLIGFRSANTSNPEFTMVQKYYLPVEKAPSKLVDKTVTRFVGDPMEPDIVTIVVSERVADPVAAVRDFVTDGKVLNFTSHCFSHKEYIIQCFPPDFDANYYLYLDYVGINQPDKVLRNDFILKKGSGAHEQFDKLNPPMESIKTVFTDSKNALDDCRKNIALNDSSCKFGKSEVFSDQHNTMTSLIKEITQLNQLIRFATENMMKKPPGVSPESAKAYGADLSILLMSPADIIQLVIYEPQGVDFQKSLASVSADVDSGLEYAVLNWDRFMASDLRRLESGRGVQAFESLFRRLESENIFAQ